MPVKLESFLAAAQNAVIPDAPNTEKLNQLSPAIVGTLDLTRQANFVEYDDVAIDLTVTSTPVFTFINTPLDAVTRYHHLALAATAWPANLELMVDIEYPGLRSNFVIFADDFDALPDPILPAGGKSGMDLIRKVTSSASASDKTVLPQGRSFDVWPRGVLRVYAGGDLIGGTVLVLSFLREVLSLQNSVDKVEQSFAVFEA